MKIYLLVDEAASGKTTILKELGYTFCPDSNGIFPILCKLIYEGKKKIAIDDYMNEGSASSILKSMCKKTTLRYEQPYKNSVPISPKDYEDVEIVLSTKPDHLNKIGLGLQARCQKVSVEEFKKIKEIEAQV